MIVSLNGDRLYGRPRSTPRLKILSTVALEAFPTYDGPTWLDTALSAKQPSLPAASGFAGKLEAALEQRRRWLVDQRLADPGHSGEWAPKPEMRHALQKRERLRMAQVLSRELNAAHVPYTTGSQVIGVYQRAIALRRVRWLSSAARIRLRSRLGLLLSRPTRVEWSSGRSGRHAQPGPWIAVADWRAASHKQPPFVSRNMRGLGLPPATGEGSSPTAGSYP
jgi:Protein of unknown function (DUF3363)